MSADADIVELGFLEDCEPWQVESCQFPSKVGGKPAWLDLESLPTYEQLQCRKCQKPMIFLCQIYAPCEEKEENFVENFHRTIFIFVCRNGECCERNSSDNIKAFRSSLPRQNKFYPDKPPELKPHWNFSLNNFVNLCNLCGVLSAKKCSQCKQTFYCSRQHQILDWRDGHKTECNSSKINRQSELLFPEREVVTETEELEENCTAVDEELRKLEELEKQGKAGTMPDVSESDLDAHAETEKDKAFHKFQKRIEDYPDQVIRYKRRGYPLWIAKELVPDIIPKCRYCGSERQFEFQIMPQLLTLLKENDLDWGVIAIYTCRANCVKTLGYKEEFVFKQDVTISSI